MYNAEKKVVTEEYINGDNTYNKMVGGIGGPDQTNKKTLY